MTRDNDWTIDVLFSGSLLPCSSSTKVRYLFPSTRFAYLESIDLHALERYDFPSSVSDNTGRRSVLGLWRTPGAPDGKTYIPATSNRRRRYGTADSSNSGESANEYGVQTQEPDLEKGAPTHETIFLAPGYAPPAKTAYDYVPPLLVFRVR